MAVSKSRQPTSATALSVVIPVYGCAAVLPQLHARLTAVLGALGQPYDIVFVDDRGKDGSWPILQGLAAADPQVVAARLSRNFGQHLAITAGLSLCRGARVVVMDCDLQDPPELIPALLEEARKGFEIVYARRRAEPVSAARKLINRVYFGLLGAVSGQAMDGEFGTLSIISRKVVDNFLRFQERDRHYLMVLRWMGFDSSVIEFERDARIHGRSSYSFARLLAHAFSGVMFTTTRLLNAVVVVGLTMASLGLVLAGIYIARYLANGTGTPGWTSVIVVQLVVGGVVIISIGITALYIGRIFQAAQNRPLFIVDDRLGGEHAG